MLLHHIIFHGLLKLLLACCSIDFVVGLLSSISHNDLILLSACAIKYNYWGLMTGFAGSALRGGGVHPDFFVKLGFEIAVDQQTRTGDQTFEGVPDPNRQSVPAGQPRPYLVQIRPNLAKYPEHAQNLDFRCSTCS